MQAEGVGGGERSGHHHPPVRERASSRGRIGESGGAPRERDGALTPEADEGMRNEEPARTGYLGLAIKNAKVVSTLEFPEAPRTPLCTYGAPQAP
jgi:hypothetical protein